MKIKTRFKILITLLTLLVLALVAVISYIGLVNYTKSMLIEKSNAAASSAAFLSKRLDKSAISRWLTDGPDEEYRKTKALFTDYVESNPFIDSIAIIRFKTDSSIAVLECIDEEKFMKRVGVQVPTMKLGELYSLNGVEKANLPRLLKGERIDAYDTETNTYFNIMYQPVFNSQHRCVAYICVTIDMSMVEANSLQITAKVVSIAVLFAVAFICVIILLVITFRRALEKEADTKVEINKNRLFDQTATALATAIDAKDTYTAGHSTRVAEYSRKLAELSGKSEKECENIYYTALLHDVGKIGVPESIITKDGKLTDEEFEKIKEHSAIGAQILESITEYPDLAIGAHYHHERYDGTGYPDGLKGKEIPEIARIIAVADAYDAMTSNRSYREAIPQVTVREQFIQCSGTQFDPDYANFMLRLIDIDTKYMMKERSAEGEPKIKDELVVHEHRSNVSKGIHINDHITQITFRVRPDEKGNIPKPSFVMFDSIDGHYHWDEKKIRERLYHEYCEIDSEGNVTGTNIRDYKIKNLRADDSGLEPGECKIQAVKVRDHALIAISERGRSFEITLALNDSASFMYIGFTGEHCVIFDMTMARSKTIVSNEYIPRIVPEISYIEGPEGDVPNIQVEGYRTASSKGVLVKDKMSVTFHTKSLPTARLIWHCPYCVLYYSDDGSIKGENYKEYALMRMDGETWNASSDSVNRQEVDRTDFIGWNEWKTKNKEGYDCTIRFERTGNKIVAYSDNFGISIKNFTEVKNDNNDIYLSVTGDQVAITNIRFK